MRQRKYLSLPKEIKRVLLNQLTDLVTKKITTAQSMIASIVESKHNETKSTAGDKYETGRAMMQAEQEKSESRLNEALKLKGLLSLISTDDHDLVQLGSVVITQTGKYYISIGLGKLSLTDQVYFAISPESPIGKLLMGKSVHDSFVFNHKEQLILEIY